MLSVTEAQNLILKEFSALPFQEIKIQHSLGRILAEPIKADLDFPLFHNSSMDGIAVIAEDTLKASPHAPVELELVGTIPAGSSSEQTLQSGQAVQIMTGAPLPPGANAIIPVEKTNLDFSQPLTKRTVAIQSSTKAGDYIRQQGEYYQKGQILLEAGRKIRPQDIALFATVGQPEVKVNSIPKVGLLTTGDELIPPDKALTPGKIRESNSFMLTALLNEIGAEVFASGIIPDSEHAVQDAIQKLANQHVDLILTSGGVSMGAFDVVREVLEDQGEVKLWKVNMRPGKPLTFGKFNNIPFVGLAGNPVSAFVGFKIFVQPALEKLIGLETPSNTITAFLSQDVQSDGRESYIPGNLSFGKEKYEINPAQNQSSGNLYSLVPANSLIILPVGVEFLRTGQMVKVIPL
jgi:molybdopterin molybdotransferase